MQRAATVSKHTKDALNEADGMVALVSHEKP